MVHIDVRYVRSFLAVAQELNITRAAGRLHLIQQAVSTHIQQLERSLQVVLLVRTSRNHAVIRTDSRAVVMSADHRLADRRTVSLADLAAEPVLRPDVLTSAEAERYWLVDPRPDGTPPVRGPVHASMGECLLEVARGHGVWLAPEPLSGSAPAGNLR